MTSAPIDGLPDGVLARDVPTARLTTRVLEVAGRDDVDGIVSDASMLDLAALGRLGAVPGWPGEEVCPPQPMIAQTAAVLDAYEAAGGTVTRLVLPGVGHSPHLEGPDEVTTALVEHLSR